MFQELSRKPIIRPYRQCEDSKSRVCLCNLIKYSNVSEDDSEESDGLLDPNDIEDSEELRSEMNLFYVDRGRYEKHVYRALTKRGYRQLIHCAQAETMRDEGWNKMEVVRLIKFAWLRNRSGFPFQKLSGKMQYWNHVPNEYCLTKKHYLAKNLKSYLASHISTLPAEAQSIHPETYFLDDLKEYNEFLELLRKTESARAQLKDKRERDDLLWIVKPVDSSGGKGISIIDSMEMFKADFINDANTVSYTTAAERERMVKGEQKLKKPTIAQKYIHNPLLLDGHKFDIRAYMFVASLDPPIVFFHKGYLRINIEKYDTTDLSNKWSHISNIGLQKNHPEYEDKKDESKWSLKTWTKFMMDRGMIDDPDFIGKKLDPQMRLIMECAYRSVHDSYVNFKRYGCFALLGVDFLVDANFKIWLLEYTKTPAGHSTLEKDDTLFADMMDEVLAILVEIDSRKSKGLPLDQLTSVNNFQRIV